MVKQLRTKPGGERMSVTMGDFADVAVDGTYRLSPDGVQLFPIVCRYAWPSELDLMARIAGLRLHDRWAGWERERFTAASRNCISVYGR